MTAPTPSLSEADLGRARAVAGSVTDPEIPVLTLEDLGVLREVRVVDGKLDVVLTPTYTGCPATRVIEQSVREALAHNGWPSARVRTTLAPPWTTDWISAEGRRKLREYGIAPPARGGEATVRLVRKPAGAAPLPTTPDPGPCCPRCDSPRVERLAEHGSTACKALYRCFACREPFDYFKPY